MRKVIYIIILVVLSQFMEVAGDPINRLPKIAKWYENRQAAVSFRFDDSLDSQVKIVIPILNDYGFKGTFMVNPGTKRFNRNREFWLGEIPKTGHILGNHTMHHKGARNLEEADYEIGETARLLWDLYPNRSKLMVFASGGGEKWGGRYWEETGKEFTDIPKNYYLIDLYDGTHPAVEAGSKDSASSLYSYVNKAIENSSHQPFVFHNVGYVSFKDRIKSLVYGYSLSFPTEEFRKFLDSITTREEILWIAPVVDVLKYETEFNSSRLEILSRNNGKITAHLEIGTDPDLFDQKLTITLPVDTEDLYDIYQDDVQIEGIILTNGLQIANVFPISSTLTFLPVGLKP